MIAASEQHPSPPRFDGAEHESDAWRARVLDSFVDGETLRKIPARRKKRQVVLDWRALKFEPGQTYTERDVNRVISKHHDDVATLRRELVGYRLMVRERGTYQRVCAPITPQT